VPAGSEGHEWAKYQQRKSEEEKTDLASRVQDALTNSSLVLEAWNEFCDSKGCGVRDPARHMASFLSRFLANVERDGLIDADEGADEPPPRGRPHGANNELVFEVRSTMSSSRHAHDTWNRLCDEKGGGIRDPSRHPPGFLRQFLAGLECLGPPKAREEPRQEPRRERRAPQGQKRPRDPWRDDFDDMSQEALAAQVKAIQSSSKRINERWTEFCTEHGDGTRDPSRHDAEFLQSFLESLPERQKDAAQRPTESGWQSGRGQAQEGAGGRDNRQRWNRRTRPRRGEPEDGSARTQESKADLVEQIKDLQRASKQNTEAWREYCGEEGGGTCDPNRHPVAFLQRFLQRMAE